MFIYIGIFINYPPVKWTFCLGLLKFEICMWLDAWLRAKTIAGIIRVDRFYYDNSIIIGLFEQN